MAYVPDRHNRRSIRLKEYDYAQPGAYFVTICTKNHTHLFGEINDDVMWLNSHGRIIQDTWDDLPNHYSNIELDAFVVMPNHIHGIIIILDDVRAGLKPAPTHHGLPEIVRGFKTFSARRINKHRNSIDKHVWHRNYWEHVIRNERTLEAIRRYIIQNPMRWDLDRYNVKATMLDPLAKKLWQTLQASIRRSSM